MDALKFVAGGRNGVTLHAPKGMAIVGDLWVADLDVLRGFHRKTGSAVASISVPGAKILNDIVAGPDGIYVTDTGVELGADGKMTHPGPDRVCGGAVGTCLTLPTVPGVPRALVVPSAELARSAPLVQPDRERRSTKGAKSLRRS